MQVQAKHNVTVDLYQRIKHEAEVAFLHHWLDRIGFEVGAIPGATPQQVHEAAQALREAVARAKGYPSDPPGRLTAFRERGW